MKQEIENKITSLRREFPFLSRENNDYIFNAVAIQTLFYKNPSYPLEAGNLKDMIVDGKGDGGIDCFIEQSVESLFLIILRINIKILICLKHQSLDWQVFI